MKDLRTYLEECEKNHPEEIVRVRSELNARWEVTALVTNVDKKYQEPPILVFDKVLNDAGRPALAKHIVNLMASRTRACRFVGAERNELARALFTKTSPGIEPITIPRTQAPVRKNILQHKEVDLLGFAPLVHHEQDAGPYLSAAFVLCYDPDTGTDNSVLQRGWVTGPDEIRWWPGAWSDNFRIFSKYEQRKKDMPIAFWMGLHPSAMLGCEMGVAPGKSHLSAAGGVQGEPIRMVPSQTLGDDFLVPADAEIVIEGYAIAGLRKPEGPFGEAYCHTGGQRWNPVVRVTGITYRDSPYWVSHMLSHKEATSGVMLEKRSMAALEVARRSVPSVVDVRSSGYSGIFFVQVDNPRPGESLDAGLAVASSKDAMKMIIVVDKDIDIYDKEDIWLALSARVQWDRDIVVIPRGRGAGTDPSIYQENVTSKIVIDATRALDLPFPKRNSVPEELLKKMAVDAYFPK